MSWTDDLETEYFGEERKASKQARKTLKEKDRSKYKKTDRDKWLSQHTADQERILSDEGILRGRVLAISSQSIAVDCEGRLFRCSLRGLLKKNTREEKNLVTVGDFVRFKPLGESEGSIMTIDKRHSILARADNLSRRKAQLIAANIDQVLITLSVGKPALKPFLADRYIIAAEKGGMRPIIVINKIDLLKAASAEMEQEKEMYEAFCQGYLSADVPVISVSTVTGEGLEELKKVMQDKASVFSGQSGVGKSSLINAVTGLDLRVGEPVDKTGKGAHTTSTTQLIPLAIGGFCIDTPGIKSFGVWNLEREEIEAYFAEIHEIGTNCKFPDCKHLNETACAVKEAVEKGELSALRYLSYINLIETIGQKHMRR